MVLGLPLPSTRWEWVQVLHRFADVEKMTPCAQRRRNTLLGPQGHAPLLHRRFSPPSIAVYQP